MRTPKAGGQSDDSPVPPDALVILLHGVGSTGGNMLSLADVWRSSLPTAMFVAPDAPFPFPHGGGRQWFSIDGVTDENRPERIAAARDDFDRVIRSELVRHDFADRLNRVVFVGFSQGSMMLLDAVATGRWPIAAAVAFAGRLATEPSFPTAPGTKLLLLHGADDAVVSPDELERASTALRQSRVAVETRIIPNLGHMISAEGARAAADFISASLAAG